LETIKEIYDFLSDEEIQISKIYLAGDLSSNDKRVGNWEDSLMENIGFLMHTKMERLT